MKKVPVSAALFIFTGVVYLLQRFPIPGVFLMMLGAPFWSVITVNSAFVFMVYESLSKRTPRWLLVFPALYFGGYFYFAMRGHQRLDQIQTQVRSENQRVRVPFEPSRHALVIAAASYDIDGMARKLVELYDVPVVYDENPNFPPARHLSYRVLADPICQKFKTADIFLHWFQENGKPIQNLCLVPIPEDPSLPVYRVVAPPPSGKRNDEPTPITITDPEGRRFELHGGFLVGDAAPLTWVPMPILGCALVGGPGPSWSCFTGFRRENFIPFAQNSGGMDSDTTLVADALGLKYAPASTRIRSDSADESLLSAYRKNKHDYGWQ
jgi:hypothetical protein